MKCITTVLQAPASPSSLSSSSTDALLKAYTRCVHDKKILEPADPFAFTEASAVDVLACESTIHLNCTPYQSGGMLAEAGPPSNTEGESRRFFNVSDSGLFSWGMCEIAKRFSGAKKKKWQSAKKNQTVQGKANKGPGEQRARARSVYSSDRTAPDVADDIAEDAEATSEWREAITSDDIAVMTAASDVLTR